MECAAIGVRMHSGWGALVAVSNSAGTVEVIDRRRVAITSPGTRGANQPYHFAENLELPEAEKFLGNCFAASKQFAMAAVRDVVGELHGRQYRIDEELAKAVDISSKRRNAANARHQNSDANASVLHGGSQLQMVSEASRRLGLAGTPCR
jgi:hypothetical protein